MKRFFLSFLVMFLVTSCGFFVEKDNEQPIVPSPPNQEGDEIIFVNPVETRDPNSDYQSSFEGQTRVPGIQTTTKLNTEILSDQLVNPWGMIQLPNNELIITQKQGSVVRVTSDNELVSIEAIFPTMNTGGQGGLLDVAIDNDFQQSKIIYFTISQQTTKGTHTAVVKGVFNDELTIINDIVVIYQALPSFNGVGHYGSRVVVDANNNLFVSTGDRQSLETRNNAQALDTAHGKIIHITSLGEPVSTNPWINDDQVNPEVYALGLRNAQGLAIDPTTNTLYASDMGPAGGDEINIIQAKENYGWPIVSYGIEYNGQPVGQGITEQEGFTQPLYYWDPSIAPSGIDFYYGDEVKEWENSLFVASLVQKHIARLMISNGKVIGEERLLENEDQRIRDVLVGNDGSLYAISDEGRLYHIKKAN